MSELDAVLRTSEPATVESLRRDLTALGVRDTDVLLVHSSLSALGWICGGAVAVVEALRSVVGTLVMPSFTGHLTDPAYWQNPPVPEEWWDTIRARSPAYDDTTPTRMMGAIVERFRALPGVVRSSHPHASFVSDAEEIVARHELDNALGEGSPLARLYERGARVLLLGVGFDRNSSFHLAEYRATWPGKRSHTQGAPMRNGWVTFEDVVTEADDFPTIGAAMPGVTRGRVACADALLFSQRVCVDFAVEWMNANR